MFDGVASVITSREDLITLTHGALKKQFYVKDVEYEARAKFRHLHHKDCHIREYVKEFQELLLEIPSMGEHDALFYFLDGPLGWAKMELKRHGV